MNNMAIIGCGRISYRHIQAAADNKEHMSLIAVCDLVFENAQAKANEYQSKMKEGAGSPQIYQDYCQMLDEQEVDIVAICTESGNHAEIAIECMNRGKHVIVEKPMALSTTDADRMIAAAKANNVKLGVCFQNRFNPPIQKLREAIEQNRFGRIISGTARVLWNRRQEYYSQAPWRGTYAQDGGCLMNQCIHNIDLLQWMLSGGREGAEINWINGDVGNFMHPYIEAEDYGSIQIKFHNGTVGNVEGTVCVYPQNLEETLTILGERGIAVIGGTAVNKIQTWRFEDGLDDEAQIICECSGEVENVYGNGHSALYEDFLDAIEEDREPYINGETGKKAMEIILATYKSSKEGKRIQAPFPPIASIDFKED